MLNQLINEVMEVKKNYSSTGLLYGVYVDGVRGVYPSEKFSGETREEVIEKSKMFIENWSLNSNSDVGFERILGCLLQITEYNVIVYDNKDFINKNTDIEFVGELEEDEKDLLLECIIE